MSFKHLLLILSLFTFTFAQASNFPELPAELAEAATKIRLSSETDPFTIVTNHFRLIRLFQFCLIQSESEGFEEKFLSRALELFEYYIFNPLPPEEKSNVAFQLYYETVQTKGFIPLRSLFYAIASRKKKKILTNFLNLLALNDSKIEHARMQNLCAAFKFKHKMEKVSQEDLDLPGASYWGEDDFAEMTKSADYTLLQAILWTTEIWKGNQRSIDDLRQRLAIANAKKDRQQTEKKNRASTRELNRVKKDLEGARKRLKQTEDKLEDANQRADDLATLFLDCSSQTLLDADNTSSGPIPMEEQPSE